MICPYGCTARCISGLRVAFFLPLALMPHCLSSFHCLRSVWCVAPFDCWVSSCQNQCTHRCGCQLVPPAAFTHQSCQCRALGSSGFCNRCPGMTCPCGCTARSMSVFQESVEKAIYVACNGLCFREHAAPLPNHFFRPSQWDSLLALAVFFMPVLTSNIGYANCTVIH